jgi:two-component sensor histidine kinase
MILHELATNAAKYGSLSVPKGQVNITWMRGANEQLILHWTESNRPPVDKPAHRGFGTAVIERMVRRFKGDLHTDWRPEGLVCQIALKI